MDNEDKQTCSVIFTLRVLGMKWVVHIVAELLLNGPQSFSELQDKLCNQVSEPITNRVLTDKLKLLESEDIIHKVTTLDHRRSVYGLTEKGEDLELILRSMKTWGVKWGSIEQKKCKTYTCIHNMLQYFELDGDPTVKFDLKNQ